MTNPEYERPAYLTILLAVLLTVLAVIGVTYYAGHFAPTPVKVAPPIQKEGVSQSVAPAIWFGDRVFPELSC